MFEKIIEKAIYDLCVQANTQLSEYVLNKLYDAYLCAKNEEKKQNLANILKNAQMADEKQLPLCQDTGQVIVFLKGSPEFFPSNINEIINKNIEKAYKENFYRKSVVKNSFERINTKTNTPAIIYTEISDTKNLEISLLIKGAGSENLSKTEMLSPTDSQEDIKNFIVKTINSAKQKGCPPYFIGVGIGGTSDYSSILAKKALLKENEQKTDLEKSILKSCKNVLDINIYTDFTHIACMPVSIAINCHSKRYAKCVINKNGQIKFKKRRKPNFKISDSKQNITEIKTTEIKKLRNLKQGQEILISGEIYTARDMVHKKIIEMIKDGKDLPFELKDKIIFYAAPCPTRKDNIQNSIGPTTASRMDKFAPILYKKGVVATIGKGERSNTVKKSIEDNNAIYFTAQGGIACLLSQYIEKSELIAFEELAPEAVYRLKVKKFPLRVLLGR